MATAPNSHRTSTKQNKTKKLIKLILFFVCGNGNAIGNATKLPCCATWWWPEWSRGGAGAGALFGSDLGFSFRAQS